MQKPERLPLIEITGFRRRRYEVRRYGLLS